MNLIVIIGCLMAGATLGICIMAIFTAGSQADDWADRYERAEADAALRERMIAEKLTRALYPERKAL